MSWVNKNLALTIVVLIAVLLVAGCSSRFVSPPKAGDSGTIPPSGSSIQPTNGRIQSNEGGAVTIDAELVGIKNDYLLFRVAMDTHSVDLDQYDLKKLTQLRDDAGNEFQAVAWDAAPGGHHRQGTMTFPVPASLSQGKTKYLELIIRDVAGINERVLKWQL